MLDLGAGSLPLLVFCWGWRATKAAKASGEAGQDMIRPALQAIMEAEADFSGHCCSAFQLPWYNNCFFAGIWWI